MLEKDFSRRNNFYERGKNENFHKNDEDLFRREIKLKKDNQTSSKFRKAQSKYSLLFSLFLSKLPKFAKICLDFAKIN